MQGALQSCQGRHPSFPLLWLWERDTCERDGGASPDLAFPALIAPVLWPLVEPPMGWHRILCTFRFFERHNRSCTYGYLR
jgi:hypothetical protein